MKLHISFLQFIQSWKLDLELLDRHHNWNPSHQYTLTRSGISWLITPDEGRTKFVQCCLYLPWHLDVHPAVLDWNSSISQTVSSGESKSVKTSYRSFRVMDLPVQPFRLLLLLLVYQIEWKPPQIPKAITLTNWYLCSVFHIYILYTSLE